MVYVLVILTLLDLLLYMSLRRTIYRRIDIRAERHDQLSTRVARDINECFDRIRKTNQIIERMAKATTMALAAADANFTAQEGTTDILTKRLNEASPTTLAAEEVINELEGRIRSLELAVEQILVTCRTKRTGR